jgi:hypothetical protein
MIFVKGDMVGFKGNQIVPVKVKYFQKVPNETKSVYTAGQQS